MKVSPVNAFLPAKEIQDTERFAGRQTQLITLSRALESDGVHIVIYGNRGVGKSSIARQLERLSTNDSAVVDRLTAKPGREFDFLPIYFSCDDTVSSIHKLLVRLLSDDNALSPWVPFKVTEVKHGAEAGAALRVKVITLSGKKSESITQSAQEVESDVVSVFVNSLRSVCESKVAKDGVLLIIDEFDRIKDRSGLASLMKALSSVSVKFAIVGVSTTIQDLITEHESIARAISDGSVHVPPMSWQESNEIFNKVEHLLDMVYSFDMQAREWIIKISRGLPFYVHLVGKHALLRTVDAQRHLVTLADAQDALAEIALKESAPVQETAYKKAIGHSYIREHIIKAFAAIEEDEIHTTELYQRIARDLALDVNAVSVYVGHLASDKYGAVLEKTRDRYYRFTDSLFKAYAAARPWQFKKGDIENDDG